MPPSRALAGGVAFLSSAARGSRASTSALRQFTTTTASPYKQPKGPATRELPIPSPSAQHPEIPAYPFGPRATYKQSNKGLYGSASIRFGNNVSEKYNVKTRRKWRPNVQTRRLYSESLGQMIRTRVTTRVLRTIDKVGGLDNYLLGTKTQRLKDLGPWGWRLRWRIMQTPKVRAMFARQREELGLPPQGAVQEFLPEGETAESLMRQTDEMLSREDEFEIGEQEADVHVDVVPDNFMAEEKRPSGAEVKNL
ncbi:hypothetical protein MCOR27_010503 [Pyricularia oryzae]|uniref:Large ribosomal subunit protein bL28m n=3 Tax=Pyricularia oryzae TaxID=318829 RepID=G4N6M7_PYRO7|nr:54S ribosomal protein L24 [Pyricularia oryzae 70-15]ELQ44899.1 54S ribosomal protein L24 [Pyricularia oryzae Y34]KAH9431051.1 hypothetical protein MCOR02_008361 [Pyricularia oryzae]EHA50696.1 54S ribosomal protein L24 [Pyricularia oryzae 70-15]KAI6263561.1 hypothetical protein MCOR19_000198 [Pyricularia oryzae]KAI6267638.1 hypothetical protein MCOR27_010503 [Pyricularia oryzae]